MDFIVKSKINTLMILCEGIGNSNLGNTIGVEEVQKVALFELAKYLMYLYRGRLAW